MVSRHLRVYGFVATIGTREHQLRLQNGLGSFIASVKNSLLKV
jgi:hypothetical protein